MIMVVITLGRAHMDSTPCTWNLAILAAFFFRDPCRRGSTPYMARFCCTAKQHGSLEESL
jgi:hypothetical protein